MTRGLLAAAALAVVLLLAWWLAPSGEGLRPEAGDACSDDTECSLPEAAPPFSSPWAQDDAAAPAAQSEGGASSEADPGGAPARERDPGSETVDPVRLREEADRLMAEGKVKEGIAALRRATVADPSLRNHADLGELLARLTAYGEAARHLRAAAELDPGNADRWIALANAYYRLVEPGEAWKAERRAQEAEPGLVLETDSEGRRIRVEPASKPKMPN